MKKIFFIEVINEDVLSRCRGTDATIVSLLPEVSLQLSKQNIVYSVPEDFLSLTDFHAREPVYTPLFFQWLKDIDCDLLSKLDGLRSVNIGPARLYAYYLNLLVDPMVCCALWLQQLWQKLSPTEVTFFTSRIKEKSVDFQLCQKDRSVVGIALAYFCQKSAAKFEIADYPYHQSWRHQWREGGLRFYANSRKRAQKYKLALKQRNSQRSQKPKLVRLHQGWGLEELELAARQSGYDVLYKLPSFSFKKPHAQQNFLNDYTISLKAFSDFVGMDMAPLLGKRLKYFIEEICPRLDLGTIHFTKLLRELRVKIVVGPHKVDFDDFALVAAATGSTTTIATQTLHGWGLFDNPLDPITEWPCNLLLTYDDEIRDHFANVLRPEATHVRNAKIWTKQYQVYKGPTAHTDRKTVLYVPTIFQGHNYRRLNACSYSDNWYFEFQRKLLDFFQRQKEFNFIWKGSPAGDKVKIPIAELIAGSHCTNVTFAQERLPAYFGQVDFALHDYPSTPLYETALARIPSLCVYHESLRIRPTGKHLFADVLRTFRDFNDFAAHVHTFLHSEPRPFILPTSSDQREALEVIESEFSSSTLAKKSTV